MDRYPKTGILVEARSFDDFGGWVLDTLYELEMGSSYLLAHGHGKPVADATTSVSVDEAGKYNVWVRAKDWVPGHHPGRFTVEINGQTLSTEFGANDKGWIWEFGGSVELPAGKVKLLLHDLTGFSGRCDAMFLGREDKAPPEFQDDPARIWRRRMRGQPDQPAKEDPFDVVVVGGGVVGVSAALTAARLGCRVALVHNRPVFGGNASMETGLRPRGVWGPLIDEIMERSPQGDINAKPLLDAEPNATLFMEHTVFGSIIDGSTIVSIDARHARSGREVRLAAPIFIDCSGRAVLGLCSGAETMYGQESRAEYSESYAPVRGDNMHHGNTVFFRTRMTDSPVAFPNVPWATEVSKDYSNLGGQLIKPGIDNGEGPFVVPFDPKKTRKRMRMPNTHFWEYGQYLDPYTSGEHIRDHLLCAIYGTFSNVKTMEPEKYKNLELEFVAFVPATGEFRRYRGDHVLTENDIRNHRPFPDAVVQNDTAFCLHYPGDEKYDFRLKNWIWDERDEKPHDIPFRCLYSRNISNLMMAGKHISVTHVAGSNTKFMGNGGQHAIATAAAAHLCKKYDTTPRGVFQNHMKELQSVAASVTGTDCSNRMSRL